MSELKVSEMMHTKWKEHALYVIENRAIPSFADGFKPVQRFLFYQGMKLCKNEFDKVAGVGSSVARIGYHHGENSAVSALTAMGADWNNNLQIFLGDGNFGSKLDHAAAAGRYIRVKMNPVMNHIFLDTELSPEHEDKEHIPPKHYLPIIPMVLVNGVKGIATGYSVDIPPMDPVTIVDAMIDMCRGKNPREIKPKYYDFTGSVTRESDSFIIEGKYEQRSPTKITITELPRGFESDSYESVLDKLQEKNLIVDYVNESNKDFFKFEVTLKRTVKWSHEEIIKHFKLRTSHTWNINTISPDGKLQEWDSTTAFTDLMIAFYQFRLPFVATRIKNKISFLEHDIAAKEAFLKFCADVIANKFSFKISEEDFIDILKNKYKMPDSHIQPTMNRPIRSFTQKHVLDIENALRGQKDELSYYLSTTPEKEYEKDLQNLKKYIK